MSLSEAIETLRIVSLDAAEEAEKELEELQEKEAELEELQTSHDDLLEDFVKLKDVMDDIEHSVSEVLRNVN